MEAHSVMIPICQPVCRGIPRGTSPTGALSTMSQCVELVPSFPIMPHDIFIVERWRGRAATPC